MIKFISALCWAGLLWTLFPQASAQSSLKIDSITIYKDAARVSLRGILRFQQQRASVELPLEPMEGNFEIPNAEGLEVAHYRYGPQPRKQKSTPHGWAEILRANAHREVTIIYQIGTDFDELAGEVARIDDQDGMLVLRRSGSDFFIPFDQIRQVAVDGRANMEIERTVMVTLLEITNKLSDPFAPATLRFTTKELYWRPLTRLQMGSSGILVTEEAWIHNGGEALEEVPVSLALRPDVPPVSLGKISMEAGSDLSFRIQQGIVEHSRSLEADLPASRGLFTSASSFEVAEVVRFDMPAKPVLGDSAKVYGPGGALVGTYALRREGSEMAFTLPSRIVDASILEDVTKRGKKPVQVNGQSMVEAEGNGRIILRNNSGQGLNLVITRSFIGTAEEVGTAAVSESGGVTTLRWKLNLQAGATKELTWEFEGYAPAP